MLPLRGQLLIASLHLRDPNFARAVVLLLAHDANGALGVVLNRPTPVPLSALARELLDGDSTPREDTLYTGGPCENAVLAVFDDTAADAAGTPGIPAAPGLRYSGDRDALESLLRTDTGQARLFSGYAGWSADQLEAEIKEEAWLILPATPDLTFSDPARLWDLTRTQRLLGLPLHPQALPKDPAHN